MHTHIARCDFSWKKSVATFSQLNSILSFGRRCSKLARPELSKRSTALRSNATIVSKNNRKGRPLKAATEKLTYRTEVNLSKSEYNAVMADYDPIFYPSKTAYLRARVVDKDIKKRVVNANLERLEQALVNSNEELNKLGVNINQIARHLNTYKSAEYKSEVLSLLQLFMSAEKVMYKMQGTIHEIHQKW